MRQQPASRRRSRASGAQHSVLLLLAVLGPLGLLACPNKAEPGDPGRAAPTAPAASPADSPNGLAAAFDGERAFAHVRQMVEIGPRPAGSAELARTRDYIIGELKSYGLRVTTDEFVAMTPVGDRRMVNVTAELPGESADVLILASHYDTKPFKEFRFVGANDGGSSTGALVELARALAASKRKPQLTYWFVFFDGEEAFCRNWDDCGTAKEPDHTYGSRRYVANLIDRGELKRVRAMILLDMIGYKKLELGRDTMSTRWLVDVIWQTARELGYSAQFVDREEGVGGDDHEPFLRAGIEAVDLIQLNSYPHWHTPEDTLDKISPQSLRIVGEVLLASLPRIEQRLLSRRAS
jgi:Zn-dependent M28 family amino/carboxypeptidase